MLVCQLLPPSVYSLPSGTLYFGTILPLYRTSAELSSQVASAIVPLLQVNARVTVPLPPLHRKRPKAPRTYLCAFYHPLAASAFCAASCSASCFERPSPCATFASPMNAPTIN